MNLRRLLGMPHVIDERIQAGRDRAGNLSFGFVMILLFIWMTIAILLERTDDYAPLALVFLAGCIFYLLQLVRSGAAYTAPDPKLGRRRILLGLAAGALAYWMMGTSLEIRDLWGKADPLPISKIMAGNAFRALLFIPGVIGLLTLIDRINRHKIDRRMKKHADL